MSEPIAEFLELVSAQQPERVLTTVDAVHLGRLLRRCEEICPEFRGLPVQGQQAIVMAEVLRTCEERGYSP